MRVQAKTNLLIEACDKGFVDIARYLIIERKFKPDATEAGEGFTALHAAAGKGHVEVVRLLLEETKVDVEARTRAVSLCCLLRIRPGFDPCAPFQGCTALLLAANNGWADVMRLLVKTGKADLATADEVTAPPI